MTAPRPPRVSLLAVAIAATVLFVGCPPQPPPPPPPPPVADAGPDQTVAPGAIVALDGSGSLPTNGGTLTFLWQQLAGTPVFLSNPHSAITTFVAPYSSAVLTFQLTVTEYPGGTSRGDTQVMVIAGPPPTPSAILYVANSAGNNMTAYGFRVPANLDGNVVPDANVFGFQTLLSTPTAAVIDDGGSLLVNNAGTPSITGYADALYLARLDGDTPPNRIVQGAATGLVGLAAMAYDPVNHLLFVAETDAGLINVYAQASTAFFKGDVPPLHVVTGGYVATPRGINLVGSVELYVANGLGVDEVDVLAPASTIDGTVIATRTIQSPAFADVADAFVDTHNTLYVVNGAAGGNRVNIFANAATLDGIYLPDATLTVVGAADLSAIVVDSAGNGYIADPGSDAIYIYTDIVTRFGLAPPTFTLSGPNTALSAPTDLFLYE
jgi:hypothetical protein